MILNWNNKPARGFASADDHWSYGSLQRVQMLSRGRAAKQKHTPATVVAAMNHGRDERLPRPEDRPRPHGARCTGRRRRARATRSCSTCCSAWGTARRSRLDGNNDGKIDDPGAAIMDAAWPRIARR